MRSVSNLLVMLAISSSCSSVAQECTEARAAAFDEPVFRVAIFGGTVAVPSRYVVFGERILERKPDVAAYVELKSLMEFGATASQVGSITFGNRSELGPDVLADADRSCKYETLDVRVKRAGRLALAYIFDDSHYMSIVGADGALWPAFLASYQRASAIATTVSDDDASASQLGARLLPAIQGGRRIGYQVFFTDPNSVIAKSGVRPGNIVTELNGSETFSSADLAEAVRRRDAVLTVQSSDGTFRSVGIR